jgi:hypothetical protein
MAKAENETKLRAAAEAMAAQQAELRAAAEAKAAHEARLRAEAEAKAAEEARIAAEAKAKAELEAMAKTENETKLRTAAEAKAAQETELRAAAETKAAQEARLRAEAETNAAEAKAKAEQEAMAKTENETKLRNAAEARAAQEAELRAAAETKAAHEATLAAEAAAKLQATAVEDAKLRTAEQDEKTRATIEILAAEQAKVLAAQERAEIEAKAAKAAADAKLTATAKRKVRHEKRVREADKAKTRALARAAPAVEPPKPKPPKKSAKSVWFYTCEGERLGPVTFEELRAMAVKQSLDPRLDMVWRQTMDAWKPAGQIDGLFERLSVPLTSPSTKELARPAAAVVAPRRSVRPPPSGGESWPGARRRSLFLVTLAFPFLWEYALAFGGPLLFKRLGEVITAQILPYAPLVPFAVALHFLLKRLTNLGMSWLWCLALAVPGLNLWVAYRCFVCPAGYAYDKKLDRPGMALAVLFWLVMLAGGSILAAIAALRFNLVENAALQEQLRQWIRITIRN